MNVEIHKMRVVLPKPEEWVLAFNTKDKQWYRVRLQLWEGRVPPNFYEGNYDEDVWGVFWELSDFSHWMPHLDPEAFT